MKHNHPKIEIMDTTLRDGEQTIRKTEKVHIHW